jgi:hypothetical protein
VGCPSKMSTVSYSFPPRTNRPGGSVRTPDIGTRYGGRGRGGPGPESAPPDTTPVTLPGCYLNMLAVHLMKIEIASQVFFVIHKISCRSLVMVANEKKGLISLSSCRGGGWLAQSCMMIDMDMAGKRMSTAQCACLRPSTVSSLRK